MPNRTKYKAVEITCTTDAHVDWRGVDAGRIEAVIHLSPTDLRRIFKERSKTIIHNDRHKKIKHLVPVEVRVVELPLGDHAKAHDFLTYNPDRKEQ